MTESQADDGKGSRGKRRANPASLVVRNPSDPPHVRKTRKLVERLVNKRGRITVAELEQLRAAAERDPALQSALDLFDRFHGSDSLDSFEHVEIGAEIPGLHVAVALGDAVAIEYAPHSASRRGRSPPFRHRFDAGKNVVLTNADGTLLLIARRKSSRMRVTERGIVG